MAERCTRLIDKHTNRPTEIFSRLADALFFHLDRACDVPGLRGTGVIEPAKYGWLSRQLGGDARPDAVCLSSTSACAADTLAGEHRRRPAAVVLRDGGHPAQIHADIARARARARPPGVVAPVRLRRARGSRGHAPGAPHPPLHRAPPLTAPRQHLNKAIARFALRDPATDEPFPTPLPRSALPRHADAALAAQCAAWLAGEVRRMRRERVEAMEDRIRNAARSRYNRYSYMAGAAGAGGATSHFAQRSYSAGAGAGGATSHFAQQGYGNFGGSAGGGGGFGGFGSGFGGGGGGGGGSDNDHATVLDTVNTLGTLANTIFGIAGGGSGLGGGMFGLGTGLFGN